jgi:HEXXH motif-containing protein
MLANDTLLSTHSNMLINASRTEPWVLPIQVGNPDSFELSDGWLFDRLGLATSSVEAELIARGFTFASREGGIENILRDAAHFLATTPSLEIAVTQSVREIVLLRASPGYDVSHSEPRWPETIFVSMPMEAGEVSALRTLENIVHEAMHLRLTTLEGVAPLIADDTALIASPWRPEPRKLQGVLHGAYVFCCISTFYDAASLKGSPGIAGIEYVTRRHREIAEELQTINFKELARGLTSQGKRFLNALFLDTA